MNILKYLNPFRKKEINESFTELENKFNTLEAVLADNEK